MGTEKRKTLEIFELLLTAEIYNRSENLTEDDLPPKIRKYYFDPVIKGVERPLRVTLKAVEKISGVDRIRQLIEENPLVVFHEIGFQLTLLDFEEGAQWFASQRPLYLIRANPVLAYFYEKDGSMNVSYAEVREQNQPFSADRELIEAKIRKLCADKKEAEDLLKLATIKAPEDVRDKLDDLILTDGAAGGNREGRQGPRVPAIPQGYRPLRDWQAPPRGAAGNGQNLVSPGPLQVVWTAPRRGEALHDHQPLPG